MNSSVFLASQASVTAKTSILRSTVRSFRESVLFLTDRGLRRENRMDFDVGSAGFIGSRAMIMLLWPDKLICKYSQFASLVMSAALVKDSLSRSDGVIGLIRCILVVAVPPRLPLVLLAMPADLEVFQTRTGRGFIRWCWQWRVVWITGSAADFRGWKLNNCITIIHYSLLFSPNYSLFISNFSVIFIIHFFFCINFPFRNFLQCNSIHWLSKVYISVYFQPYL